MKHEWRVYSQEDIEERKHYLEKHDATGFGYFQLGEHEPLTLYAFNMFFCPDEVSVSHFFKVPRNRTQTVRIG